MRRVLLMLRGMVLGAILLAACSGSRSAEDEGAVDRPAPPPRPPKREYVGLARRDAALKAWSAGQSYRIVEVDGRKTGGEGPPQPGRLNFTLRNDVVVKVTED